MHRTSVFVPAALMAAVVSISLAQQPATTPAKPEAQPPKSEPQKPAEQAKPAEAPKPEEPKPVNREEKEGGLLVEDFVIGTGTEAKPADVVLAHYRGTLRVDGREFDSTIGRNEPALFSLSRVVRGWQVGIPGMKVGGKRRLTVPAAMGYGPQAMGDKIPANSDLVFDVELLQVADDVKIGDGQAFVRGASTTIKYTMKKQGATDAFASSGDKAEEMPYQFAIPGFQAALEGMKAGGKRKFLCPQSQTWQQKPSIFAPGTLLECEIELVSVQGMPGGMPMNR